MNPITDPGVLEGYLTDASNVHGHAEGLLRPRDTEEVAQIVAWCQSKGIPLTISAARTSTTAGPVPFGGWVLSMEHLDAIEHIGPDTATAQAGVILGDLQREIEQTGRLFPPDPTSRNDCTLGAAIACNASGARTFRYGPTRDWIEALEVVLPDGEVRTVRRGDAIPEDWPRPSWEEPAVKTAAGYVPTADLLDVFIGQEGTLGIVTRATVRLTALPAQVIGVVAFFDSTASAVSFMQRIRDAARSDASGDVSPRCIEYFDQRCVELARGSLGSVPDEATAALFCEQEVTSSEDEHLGAWWELLEEHDGALSDDTVVTTDDNGRAKLHAFRHAIPAGINERVVRNGMPKVGTDLAVPDAALAQMMEAYEAAPIEHVLFGHIGDNHLHLNMLPRDENELRTAKAYYDELAALAVSLGGTVSAEHGIGKTKKAHLGLMVDDGILEQFRALKSHLDPGWILGRGTLFEPPV